jgi:hypothetical protein
MYRYDYVLRLIERLGAVLRTLRDRLLRREYSDEDLRVELATIARESGLDIEFARRLDPAMLVSWLAPMPDRLDPERIWLMAELLHVEGLSARERGEAERAEGDFRRALALFALLEPAWKPRSDFPSAGERVDELRALLPNLAH